jgi:hypothetical protein
VSGGREVAVDHRPVQLALLGACGAGAGALLLGACGAGVVFSGAGGAGAGALLLGACGAGMVFSGAGGAGAGVLLLGACGAGMDFSGAGGAGAGVLLLGACGAGALFPGACAVWAWADDVRTPARTAAPTHRNIRWKLMDSVSHNVAPPNHHTHSRKGNPNPPTAEGSPHYNASLTAVSEDFAEFSENV